MISLTFEPTPLLTIDNQTYHGINIIEKLSEIMDESVEAKELFRQAASAYQRTRLPRLGFNLQNELAVFPTKRIIDVGYDLTAVAVYSNPTQMTTLYETYVSLDIPLGYYVELVPRSSISKTGYMLANSIGVIDGCFTGTLKIPLIKVDASAPNLELPAKVAQLILKPYIVSESYITDTHIETKRGTGGFGSTN